MRGWKVTNSTCTDHLHNKVLNFVSDWSSVSTEKLGHETSLLHDLGIDGEDASDFLIAFGKKYNLDPQACDFYASCFSKEDPWSMLSLPLGPLTTLILRFLKPAWLKKIPLSIGDLCAAAGAGEWQSPMNKQPRFPWEKSC